MIFPKQKGEIIVVESFIRWSIVVIIVVETFIGTLVVVIHIIVIACIFLLILVYFLIRWYILEKRIGLIVVGRRIAISILV